MKAGRRGWFVPLSLPSSTHEVSPRSRLPLAAPREGPVPPESLREREEEEEDAPLTPVRAPAAG